MVNLRMTFYIDFCLFGCRQVQHENIVRFIGACTKLPHLCIVTGMAQNLLDFLFIYLFIFFFLFFFKYIFLIHDTFFSLFSRVHAKREPI